MKKKLATRLNASLRFSLKPHHLWKISKFYAIFAKKIGFQVGNPFPGPILGIYRPEFKVLRPEKLLAHLAYLSHDF
jgi:hypothetical protein